jgi:hypothetical protein
MTETSKSIKTGTYATLVNDIAELYNHARKALVESYWQIGKRIVEQEQQGDDTPEYGARLLEQLSEDLQHKLGKGFSVRNLRKMRRFYLSNPNPQTSADLTWSQHVELLPVTNKADKRRLERRICTHHYDKYARYLADVFYLPDSINPKAIYTQGIYLNQQLIDKGLARQWKP